MSLLFNRCVCMCVFSSMCVYVCEYVVAGGLDSRVRVQWKG